MGYTMSKTNNQWIQISVDDLYHIYTQIGYLCKVRMNRDFKHGNKMYFKTLAYQTWQHMIKHIHLGINSYTIYFENLKGISKSKSKEIKPQYKQCKTE